MSANENGLFEAVGSGDEPDWLAHRGVDLLEAGHDERGRPTLTYACDCATVTVLVIDIYPGTTGVAHAIHDTREVAFTCDGCQSAHWVTFTINGEATP